MHLKLIVLFYFYLILVLLMGCGVDQSRRIRETRRTLSRICAETEMLVIETHKIPEKGIDDWILHLNDFSESHKSRSANFRGIEQGLDAWGQKIVLEVESNTTILFRSLGPNGKDDFGCFDDIAVRLDCSDYVNE